MKLLCLLTLSHENSNFSLILFEQYIMAIQVNLFSNSNSLKEEHIHITNIYGEKKEIPKFFTLPIYPDGLQFVHRGADLAHLKTLLDKNGVAQLVQGIGGIGKTSLSVAVVEQIQSNFEYVIFVHAYFVIVVFSNATVQAQQQVSQR